MSAPKRPKGIVMKALRQPFRPFSLIAATSRAAGRQQVWQG